MSGWYEPRQRRAGGTRETGQSNDRVKVDVNGWDDGTSGGPGGVRPHRTGTGHGARPNRISAWRYAYGGVTLKLRISTSRILPWDGVILGIV